MGKAGKEEVAAQHQGQVWGAGFPATGWTQCSENILYLGEDTSTYLGGKRGRGLFLFLVWGSTMLLPNMSLISDHTDKSAAF